MSENDLKTIISKYQQKSFELFNQNIVLESQIENLQQQVSTLKQELDKTKTKRTSKSSIEEF